MDNYDWLLNEIVYEEALRRRLLPQRNQPLSPTQRHETLSRVKRALASTLVRLGLRLDPAAGEGLAALDLTLARPEARPQA
jgi:hypothetical protein